MQKAFVIQVTTHVLHLQAVCCRLRYAAIFHIILTIVLYAVLAHLLNIFSLMDACYYIGGFLHGNRNI